jgi:RNA polymerase sigma-70 factor, ECF subfamily
MNMANPYTQQFLSRLTGPLAQEAGATPSLEERLRGFVARAREAWPRLDLADQAFVEGLAERLMKSPPTRGLAQWLDHVHPEDLWLALVCARGDHRAIVAFEEHYRADLEKLAGRYQGSMASAQELRQTLREKLFVGEEGRAPRINEYSGQGYLQNWLRVTGARAFIDQLRSTKARGEVEQVGVEDRLLAAADTGGDPELNFLKQEYRERFREAFGAAVRALSSEDRTLLRQHLVAGLTLDQLGKLHGAHLSTISRRIQKLKGTLLETTREELRRALKLEADDLDSLMALIQSRLDVSVARLLEKSAAG